MGSLDSLVLEIIKDNLKGVKQTEIINSVKKKGISNAKKKVVDVLKDLELKKKITSRKEGKYKIYESRDKEFEIWNLIDEEPWISTNRIVSTLKDSMARLTVIKKIKTLEEEEEVIIRVGRGKVAGYMTSEQEQDVKSMQKEIEDEISKIQKNIDAIRKFFQDGESHYPETLRLVLGTLRIQTAAQITLDSIKSHDNEITHDYNDKQKGVKIRHGIKEINRLRHDHMDDLRGDIDKNLCSYLVELDNVHDMAIKKLRELKDKLKSMGGSPQAKTERHMTKKMKKACDLFLERLGDDVADLSTLLKKIPLENKARLDRDVSMQKIIYDEFDYLSMKFDEASSSVNTATDHILSLVPTMKDLEIRQDAMKDGDRDLATDDICEYVENMKKELREIMESMNKWRHRQMYAEQTRKFSEKLSEYYDYLKKRRQELGL